MTEVKSRQTIRDAAVNAMKAVRSEIMSCFCEAGPWSDNSKRQRIIDYGCEIMVAYSFNGDLCLFTISLDDCLDRPREGAFAAIGCAENIAASVLSGFNLAEMSTDSAFALAAYTIEVCKKNDWACGGDVQMAVLTRFDKPHPVPPFFFKDAAISRAYMNAAEKTTVEMRDVLTKKLVENFRQIRINQGGPFVLHTLLAVGKIAEDAVVTSAQLYSAKKITEERAREVADLYDRTFQPAFRVAAASCGLESFASADLLTLAMQLHTTAYAGASN